MGRITKRDMQMRRLHSEEAPKEKIVTDLEGLATVLVSGHGSKAALNPTQKEFIFGHERRQLYKGRVGAAKSSSLVASVIIPALLYPGSEWLIARFVYWSLEQTTMKRFFELIGNLGPDIIEHKVDGPPCEVWLRPMVPGPSSHIIFQSLDDPDKWKSLQLHGVAIDEVDEISEKMAQTLDERCRAKYPGQENADGPFFWRGACNPPPKSHWIHRYFCGEDDGAEDEHCLRPSWGKLFKPRKEENLRNLPADYYETIAQGKSASERIRLIDGDCGPDMSGEAVFKEKFNEALHVGDFTMLPNLPGIRSWDFGRRRPSCVWAQRQAAGQVIRYLAILGENESTESFCRKVLALTAVNFPQVKQWQDFCDPHGAAMKSNSDKSDVDILRDNGVNPAYKDVAVKTGLDLMEQGLSTLISGRPRSMYDRRGCKILIEGYQSGYQWPATRGNGELPTKPKADGYYEHPMDCDRYIEVNLHLNPLMLSGKAKTGRVLRKIRNSTTGY